MSRAKNAEDAKVGLEMRRNVGVGGASASLACLARGNPIRKRVISRKGAKVEKVNNDRVSACFFNLAPWRLGGR
jgi:hypothetical protein